ncbi:hypothetical protein [Flavicella marina]|uniref:hypothetical protein n=1 Tax=Flavicella marina TaxID=1475951 RepID=UPI00126515CB|nr:hypothetical protein [Flavicella marina]
MKKLSFLLFLTFFLACDDGEFNVPSFDFDGLTINNCGNLVFYKTTSSATESLMIQLDVDNTDDIFFKVPFDEQPFQISESGVNSMSYRIFNDALGNDYFCQDIPPTTPVVSESWTGEGTLLITNTIALDDNDGVPSEIEKVIDPDTGTWLDTDKDGYPDYIDIDDDGDNKLTINEDIDITTLPISNTGDPTLIDTDGDGTLNYLDTDDDNDNVLSINESETGGDANNNGIPAYLDVNDTDSIEAASPVTNNYTQSYSMFFFFESLILSSESGNTITYPDGYTYGTKTGSFTTSELPTE